MSQKKITVIGATGNMGKGITELFSNVANVTAYSRSEDNLGESVVDADIVVFAVPYAVEQQLAEENGDLFQNKIVISISNPVNESYDDLVTGWNSSAGEELQSKLPSSKVVKAFNTIFASQISADKLDHFIAGNDEAAVNTVQNLLEEVGHNPIPVGGIEYSRMLEHMALVNIKLSVQEMFQWNSAYSLRA